MVLALVYAARKLRPYFQSHRIVVLTDQPLKSILQKPETSDRLVKWAVELGEFDTGSPDPVVKGRGWRTLSSKRRRLCKKKIATQRAGSGAGVVLRTPKGVEIAYSVTLAFPATNNVAEYEALLAGLRLAKECSARSLVVRSDSELVVNQVKGNFDASNPQLVRYLAKVKALIPKFGRFEIEHITKTDNERADRLARDAAAGTMERCERARKAAAPGVGLGKEILRVNEEQAG
ncbi:hypothetical protein Nepgr_033099 [Nepenthes gracilis]|uniref:RNase H type-1 domain-containing protein n=1 Tax=Nepenthes gracilis TaxID=150966 RepID=A0AAD3TLE0_NEPGR|nr:hypothetical protein Nepgr_033099 [Nepenthes gracilis]